MNPYLSSALLLLFGAAAEFFFADGLMDIIAFFLAICLASCVQFVSKAGFLYPFFALYWCMAFRFPVFLCFFPLLIHDFLSLGSGPNIHRILITLFLSCVPVLFIHRELLALSGAAAILCMSSVGGLLAWYESETLRLRKLYYQNMDDHTEYQNLLREKNRTLLDKQNSEIYAATLKERNRIAREIHDNVGHLLSRSILMVGAVRTVNRDTALNTSLEQLESSLNQAMTSIRTSVHDLYDEALNLKEAVEKLVSSFSFCSVSLEYDMGSRLPPSIRYCFLSILKEALSNVIRHSDATSVDILMREHEDIYQLIIQDNGSPSPFSPPSDRQTSGGMGLSSMKERVQNLHGSIRFTCDNGFRIFVLIPKTQTGESHR